MTPTGAARRTTTLSWGAAAVWLALTAGCAGSAPVSAPTKRVIAPATPGPAVTPAPGGDAGGSGRGGGHGPASGGRPVAPSLPADWPADVPLPPGQLQGTTAGAGRWSALLLVSGSADASLKAGARVYLDAGFTALSDSLFRKGKHLVTIGVENRDHSATQTNLVVAISPLP